ncbi:MAG: aldehyde dehydrogenase [Ramlibacter sp.]|nr:aldehyde dehydrogenase [Ramlibacter sp.]
MDGVLPPSFAGAPLLGDWIRVRPDGGFDIRTGKVELGQGISAALIQIACTGLGVEPDQVKLIAGDTALCPDEGYTAGSQSIEVGGAALRHASAAARQVFAAEAAQRLGISASEVRVARGIFSAEYGERGMSYRDLARTFDYGGLRIDALQVDSRSPIAIADVASAPCFLRSDLPAKLTGGGFIHDMAIEGMLHARVLRGRHPFSRPILVDLAALRALPGVTEVLRVGDFLAVGGSDEASVVAASTAAARLVEWQVPVLPPFGETEAVLTALPAETSIPVSAGTPPAAGGGPRLTRRYSRPYIAHAAIGTACALAAPAAPHNEGPFQLTVWSHTQGAFKLRDQIAEALQLEPGSVRVIHVAGAGCYGHNGADDVAFDAALLARAWNRPVRVQWSRRDELTVSPMGAASLVELQAGLDGEGTISDLRIQVWSHTHLARPGWGQGVNLLGAWAADPAIACPAPLDVPLPTGGGLRNSIPGYELPALEIRHHFIAAAPMRVSALRSLGSHANLFALESFMDELAAAANVDPVEFRLRHLKDGRARHVVQTAARMCDWAARTPGGEGRGLGFGFGRYKNRAGYFAVATEVSVEAAVKVEKVWAAVDVGAIVHRDGLLNQVEGGIVQALSWSLKEAVRWGPEGILTSSWDDYPILNFDEVPLVAIELIDRPDQPSLGAGEVAAGPVAGALGNAIAHALEVRARHLPFTADRLLDVIQAG